MCSRKSLMAPEFTAELGPIHGNMLGKLCHVQDRRRRAVHQGSLALADSFSRNRLTLQLGTCMCAALSCAAEALPTAFCTIKRMVQQPEVACMWVQWVCGRCVTYKSECLEQVQAIDRQPPWQQPCASLVESHLVSFPGHKAGADAQLPPPPHLCRLRPE
jgi:hypothetical protein